MKLPHLFEFMDLDWLPGSLHATLREILECGNGRPFRPYYSWVAQEVTRLVRREDLENTVELGAGTAPITRLLAGKPDLDGVRLIVSDAFPDRDTYEDLEKRYPGKVAPQYEPVDFSKPRAWPDKTLLFLSGTFHHLPPDARGQVLESLTASADRIMICEPLRKTPLSVFFVFFSIFPALFLPLWFLARPGRLRRFLWCWLFPVAPFIFWWDGLASCLRMWTDQQWRAELQKVLPADRNVAVDHTLFCQMVVW